VPGAHVFFGQAFHPFDTLLLWAVAIIVLSLPWILIGRIRLGFGIPLALAIGLVLPTGIENPLTVAGVLFPATAWFGLVLTLIVFGMIAERPRQTLAVAFVVSLFCHVARPGSPAIPAGWSGVDTSFGGSGMMAASPLNLYQTAVSIQSRALASSATATVFPESVVRSWNESTDLFWEPTFAELRRRGQTIIVGATVTRSGRNRYRNILILRGAHTATFEQRVPVPYAMWNPLAGEGVEIHPNGPAVFDLNGQRVAPIICYEQFLGGPVLLSMLHRPSVILAVANDYWAKGTTIPAIQSESIDAWSRLFWVPAVKSINQ